MSTWKCQRAMITGASSGIGEATARRFAQAGVEVVIVSEQAEALGRVADSIRASQGKATPLVADFSKPEQVAGLFARAEAEVGPLDTLVNNAGIGLGATILEMKPSDLRLLFEINFFALVELSQQALQSMKARRSGRIINVTSGSARLGLPGVSGYSATKGAVHTFTAALRGEARPHHIGVAEVLPVSVKTAFFDNVKGEKYRPSGVVVTAEAVAECLYRCATRPRIRPEVLPYRPLWFAFVADALCPGILDRFLVKGE